MIEYKTFIILTLLCYILADVTKILQILERNKMRIQDIEDDMKYVINYCNCS